MNKKIIATLGLVALLGCSREGDKGKIVQYNNPEIEKQRNVNARLETVFSASSDYDSQDKLRIYVDGALRYNGVDNVNYIVPYLVLWKDSQASDLYGKYKGVIVQKDNVVQELNPYQWYVFGAASDPVDFNNAPDGVWWNTEFEFTNEPDTTLTKKIMEELKQPRKLEYNKIENARD